MKIGEIAVDLDRVENGAWVDDVPDMAGLRLKVRGSSNKDWRRLTSKLLDKVPRKKRHGSRIDTEEAENITNRCLLETCLLDWEGLTDDEGKPLPYSKEMAEKLLLDPQYRRFRDACLEAANLVSNQNADDVEDAAGNLVRLSPGVTGGERKSKVG